MSSGKSKDTFEPLKLDTTLLKIEIKADGDLKTKEYDLIPFHPNMADMKDLSNNNYILFPSFVKITLNDLQKSTIGQDYKKVFTNLEQFINLIKYVTNPDKEEDDFTLLVDQRQIKNYAISFVQDFVSDIISDFRSIQKYEPLTPEEIITNNIGLIKSLFFPINGRFFILGHEYVIAKSQYIPPYKASSAFNKAILTASGKSVPLHYDINIELQLLDATNNPNVGDFSRLSCKAKKISIKNDMHEIFDLKLGLPEQPKAVLPSLTVPTTTSKRGFTKLQLDWEARNKYVKPPTTEAERIAQEKALTPLQRKMAKFDKKQEEYNKIPPLWIKEIKDLQNKYDTFDTDILKYQKKYQDDKKEDFNTSEIEAKIKEAIKQVLGSGVANATAGDELFKDIIANKNVVEKEIANKTTYINAFLKKFKFDEETAINAKYVAPFLVDFKEKEKDVAAAKLVMATLKEQLKQLQNLKDNYNASSKQQELIKAQNKYVKIKGEETLLLEKLGTAGSKLIDKWKKTLEEMNTFKANIQSEKTIDERRIVSELVTKELKEKREDIKKLKDLILKANYFEGNQDDLTKSEKDKFKNEQPPLEELSNLNQNLIELKKEYLEIAYKSGALAKVQAYIALLNDDVERFKKVRSEQESEKRNKDRDIQEKIREIVKIRDQYSRRENDNDMSETDKNRKDKLIAEQIPLQESIDKLDRSIKKMKMLENNYGDVIQKLRRLKETTPDLLKELEKEQISQARFKKWLKDLATTNKTKAENEIAKFTLEESQLQQQQQQQPTIPNVDKKLAMAKKALEKAKKEFNEATDDLTKAESYPNIEDKLIGGKKRTLRKVRFAKRQKTSIKRKTSFKMKNIRKTVRRKHYRKKRRTYRRRW